MGSRTSGIAAGATAGAAFGNPWTALAGGVIGAAGLLDQSQDPAANPYADQTQAEINNFNQLAANAPEQAKRLYEANAIQASNQINRSIASTRGITAQQALQAQKGLGSNILHSGAQSAANAGLDQQARYHQMASALMSGAGAQAQGAAMTQQEINRQANKDLYAGLGAVGAMGSNKNWSNPFAGAASTGNPAAYSNAAGLTKPNPIGYETGTFSSGF